MTWIEYDYLCNENKGIAFHKKIEYNEANLAIAQEEAIDGNYTITEDEEVIETQPLAIELGGTNAKTAEEACKNVGGINIYTHASNGLTGMGVNGKFKATATGAISSINVNGVACSVKCGEETSMDLVAGCWYTFILDGNTVNFNAGGAGAGGLNFKVVGNPQPVSPKENTIWLNTDVSLGKWFFSATQPELSEGDVWFPIGTSSPVEFNALKKNGIQVYPFSAKQMVDDGLVDVEAKSYQGGAWVDLIPKGALYYKGNECENNGGKWVNKPWAINNNGYSGAYCTSIERTDEDITMIFVGGDDKSTTLIKENLVDLTDYSTLTFKYVASGKTYINFFATQLGSTYFSSGANTWGGFTGAEEVAAIDVSALSGKYVVGVGVAQNDNGQTAVVTLKEVMLS